MWRSCYAQYTHVSRTRMRNNGSLHRRVLLIREEGKWEEGRGGGVGGTRYHKSFRAKGSQLSYALKASRVSIGALSLSLSPSKGEFTRNVDGALDATRGAISIITTNVRHLGWISFWNLNSRSNEYCRSWRDPDYFRNVTVFLRIVNSSWR